MESVRNLTEGLSALSSGSHKKLFSLLKTMVILAHREGRPLLVQDTRLLVQVVRLLADFQVGCGTELKSIIQEAIDAASFQGLSELSYLAMCAEETYVNEETKHKILSQIEHKVEELESRRLVLSIQERLALAVP